MKNMSCIDCNKGSFSADSSEEMMKVMMPHYMSDHKEMMDEQNEESKSDWMQRFGAAWDVAREE